jgi:hypothetical protein
MRARQEGSGGVSGPLSLLVELARNGLQSFGGGVLVCGDEDEGEGVAFEFRLGLV